MAERPHFIVAELSKNWREGGRSESSLLLSQQFEACIAANEAKGYWLHSWKLHRMHYVCSDGQSGINETIFAVFEDRAIPLKSLNTN